MNIVKIVRIISRPQGHLLLVGLNGIGKQSMLNIAAYLANIRLFRIENVKNYGLTNFREDVQKSITYLFRSLENKSIFLLNDFEIQDEQYLEIISNVINCGDIDGFYEKKEDMDQLVNLSKDLQKQTESKDQTLNKFIQERLGNNMNFVMTMSPVG